jgi:transcriptional regulator with PAS, ATPase and Fis domain
MRQRGYSQLVGASRAIAELKAEIERIAHSDAKVLITGESGSGKEVVARAICASSPRCDGPFVPVNCAGIPETLLESELFGHVKGSFTGAYRDKPGKLEMADNGTIFLDEIGEMTLRMQGLLLRFLETSEIQKVGSERSNRANNVRVITATNRDLSDLMRQGLFREDLFYRINVLWIVVPPLRDRRDDIPLLVDYFLNTFTGKAARPWHAPVATDGGDGNGNGGANGYNRTMVRGIAPEAMAALVDYPWPGNVRQLENVLERLVVTCRREMIQVDDLPPDLSRPGQPSLRPRRERRKTVADELYRQLREQQLSFWDLVYPLYMEREITRGNVRELVHKGLGEARGNYKIVLRLFNMESADYKRFLNFLRKHDCQLPFKEYR